MSFTVADALNLQTFQNATLLAGEKGLHKPIRWVNILEILDEISLVHPNELLITTAFGLADDTELQQQLMATLADKQLSGLAIQTGHYLKKIPQTILEDAHRLEIPLIELPQNTSFSQITTDLLAGIANRQFALLDYRENIRWQLLQVVLNNEGFNGLIKILNKYLGACPIRILDYSYNPVAHGQVNEEILKRASLTQELRHLYQHGHLRKIEQTKKLVFVSNKYLPDIGPQVLVPVIAAGNQVLGFISVANLTEQLSTEQIMVLDQSATICALLFLQDIAVKETESRLQGDFLDDLLAENFSTGEQIIKRADFLGYDLKQYGMVLLVNINNFSEHIKDKHEVDIIYLKSDLLRLVNSAIKDYTLHQSLTRLRSDYLIAFVLAPAIETTQWQKQLAQYIRQKITRYYPELSLSMGIGRFYNNIYDFGKSFTEAEKALRIAHKFSASQATAAFQELGFYRLLLGRGEQELVYFFTETIGNLVEYDAKKGTSLEKTLAVYLQCNQNIQNAATILFVHRHTLRYRLKRIEEITGISLNDADNIFNLQIGLKLHKILG